MKLVELYNDKIIKFMHSLVSFVKEKIYNEKIALALADYKKINCYLMTFNIIIHNPIKLHHLTRIICKEDNLKFFQ